MDGLAGKIELAQAAAMLKLEISSEYRGNEGIWLVVRDLQRAAKANDEAAAYSALDRDPKLRVPEILGVAYLLAGKPKVTDWLTELTAGYLANNPDRVKDYCNGR